jgi:hypothetical protein
MILSVDETKSKLSNISMSDDRNVILLDPLNKQIFKNHIYRPEDTKAIQKKLF